MSNQPARAGVWAQFFVAEPGRFFPPAADRPGHVELGARHARTIFRRLYQARYQPGSEWDFLTYFEFSEADAGAFRALLAALRDPALNPEWAFVERETEI